MCHVETKEKGMCALCTGDDEQPATKIYLRPHDQAE